MAALAALPPLGPLCPLRRLTGVPCPLCGTTTGVLALVRGDVAGSLAANPVALVVVAAVALAWARWLAAAWAGRAPTPLLRDRWRGLATRAPVPVLALLEVFELHRFGFV